MHRCGTTGEQGTVLRIRNNYMKKIISQNIEIIGGIYSSSRVVLLNFRLSSSWEVALLFALPFVCFVAQIWRESTRARVVLWWHQRPAMASQCSQ